MTDVAGTCDARFEPLRDVLRENVATRGELGAAVTAIVDGRVVADLWVGHADAARTQPWREDTVVCVFSVGKALAALCALRLVDRGRLDLDAPDGALLARACSHRGDRPSAAVPPGRPGGDPRTAARRRRL